VDESRECGLISEAHLKDFFDFVRKYKWVTRLKEQPAATPTPDWRSGARGGGGGGGIL
jgi:hypothetical protein